MIEPSQEQPRQLERRREKGAWDKFEILSKPIGGLLTALAIALLGYFGQSALTEIATQDQNARLYTELLSKREQSESELRKDMFSVILKDFFEKKADSNNPTSSSKEVSQKLLKLEMLAMNFGDSLSLGPLFLDVSREISQISRPSDGEGIRELRARELRTRLNRLAKQVARVQLAALQTHGKSVHIVLDIDRISSDLPTDQGTFIWPDDEALDQNYAAEEIDVYVENRSKLILNEVTRSLTMSFSNANSEFSKLDVELTIAEEQRVVMQNIQGDWKPSQPVIDEEILPVEISFTLDFFNFPLIDNTRLSNNQRFALVMTDFDEESGKIFLEGILFPGEFSSQRDKPYLVDAMKELEKRGKGDRL